MNEILTNGENLHYLVIGVAVLLIFFFQCKVYFLGSRNTKSLARKLSKMFPKDFGGLGVRHSKIITEKEFNNYLKYLTTQKEQAEGENLAAIEEKIKNVRLKNSLLRGYSDSLKSLIDDINNYLSKNEGGVIDYNIIRDMVDRTVDTKESEVSTQVPIPLYLGLMGTMIGIIVGITYFISSHGLAGLLSADTELDKSAAGIESLLICVAIAMVASFIGVFFTTRSSVVLKNAKNDLEEGKRHFLSWIQAELLPLIGTDVSGSLVRMSENLVNFNSTFSKNTKELNKTLLGVKDTSATQKELLDSIRSLNVNQLAEANVKVYSNLKNSTDDLERLNVVLRACTQNLSDFTSFMQNSKDYLDAVRALNEKLDDAEERTKGVEEMAAFFRAEMTQIAQRERAMKENIGQVDLAIRDTFNGMQEAINDRLLEFRNNLTNLDLQFTDATEAIGTTLQAKLKETEQLMDEIKQLAPLKQSIDELNIKTNEQNAKFDALIKSIESLARAKTMSPSSSQGPISSPIFEKPDPIKIPDPWKSIPTSAKVCLFATLGIISFTCVAAISLVAISLLMS